MEYVIDIQNVKKYYVKRDTKEKLVAVKGINLQINKGEIVGLLGPNGAGKTTLIKMMCGLLIPDEGKILINGIDIQKKRLKALSHISVVLEGNRNVYWRLTVEENLEYFAGNRGFSKEKVKQKINELIERFNLTEKRNEMVNTLSRGMQQKVAIAIALLANTDVIFLDEPTLGLDIETSYEIRKIIKEIAKEEGKTIIISSHDMPVVQDLCERVVIVNHGQIITDDHVKNYLRLFESKAYLFTLHPVLTNEQLSQIEKSFIVTNVQHVGGMTLLEVNIAHNDGIYKIIEMLKHFNVEIEKIDRIQIEFEEVFMRIVKGEMQYEMAHSI